MFEIGDTVKIKRPGDYKNACCTIVKDGFYSGGYLTNGCSFIYKPNELEHDRALLFERKDKYYLQRGYRNKRQRLNEINEF